MNDAYTIGLTLALDDGVSAGIETIRRELNALDKAIVASTTDLLRLQEAARTAVSAGVTEAAAVAAAARNSAAGAMRVAATPTRTIVEPAAEPAIAPSAVRTDEEIVPTAATSPHRPPSAAAVGNSAAPAPLPRFAPEPPMVVPSLRTDVAAAPIGSGGQLGSRADLPLIAAPLPAAAPPLAREGQAVPAVAPTVLVHMPTIETAKPDALTKVSAPSAPLAPAVKVIEQTVVSPAPAPYAAKVPPAVPAVPVPPAPKPVERRGAPAVRIDVARPAPLAAPAPRVACPLPGVAPPARAAQMAPSAEPPRQRFPHESAGSAAPRQTAERHREQSMAGNIVIDGFEFGRWMADHLAHAATRPPGGGVGFDPRMTPVWAGAPIGA